MGIGLVMIVAEHFAASIVRHLKHKAKVPAWIIGEVIEGNQNVVWE
jgi:phosphoribosylformylglycinamidine cyclo-ligase